MASSSQKRTTTVHDRAALRVHPDGTRVTNRESRYATQDLRGNRIATNAAGTGNVKKRKRPAISDRESEPLEEFEIQSDEYHPSEDQSASTDSCAGEVEDEFEEEDRKRKRKRKDPRTVKRAQFYQNLDFVRCGRGATDTRPASSDPLLPSSDLLKCLHHFAAKYYFDKGQLIDASRIARKRKKSKANIDAGSRSSSGATANPVPGEESDHSSANVPPTLPTTLQTQKHKGRKGADHVKDMYKVFDGSALVALGVFVHEHLERLMRQDWDQEGNMEESEQEDRDCDEEDG